MTPKITYGTKVAFQCSDAEFRRVLRRRGVKESEFRLVPGFYEDSLMMRSTNAWWNKSGHCVRGLRSVCFDKSCPRVPGRYLVNGTIICFDDYYHYKGAIDQGEQLAFREFATDHPEMRFIPYFDFCPLGKSFIVRLD